MRLKTATAQIVVHRAQTGVEVDGFAPTTQSFAAAFDHMLSEQETFRENARRVSASFRNSQGSAGAAQALIDLIA